MSHLWLPILAGLATFFGALGLRALWKFSIHGYLLLQPSERAGGSAVWRALVPVAGLGGIATGFWFGRPIFGLLALPLVPVVGQVVARLRGSRHRRALDGSAIAWFHALNGLLRAGISLPSAIFRLADFEASPFPATLGRYLGDYEEGRSLADCLSRFRKRGHVDRAASLLALLEMAYRSGLPVCPLLDRMLPVLEHERLSHDRVADVRRSVFFQAALVGLAPWALSLVYATCEPEAARKIAEAPWFPALLGGALVLELTGGWVLWNLSRFD